MLYKYCGRCKKLKPVDEFAKNKRSSDGYEWICKLCAREYRNKKYNSQFEPVDRNKILALHYQGLKITEIQKNTGCKLMEIRKVISWK